MQIFRLVHREIAFSGCGLDSVEVARLPAMQKKSVLSQSGSDGLNSTLPSIFAGGPFCE
jgi:hypothetical protein